MAHRTEKLRSGPASTLVEYAQHVGKHGWSVVVGAVGGGAFLISLFASIVIPTWLGATFLVVGIFIAQFLAFKDMRQERNQAVDALIDARLEPRAQLSACYGEGRSLQETFVLRRSMNPEEAENKARTAVYLWAEKTWKVLKKHFPGHERGFFGPGRVVEPLHVFEIYCEQEIQRCGNSADSFLEAKLEYIGDLLRVDGPK